MADPGLIWIRLHIARFQERILPVLVPKQFRVNEAWIAFKLNTAPVTTTTDGDFHVLALMDAASGFILGTEFVSADSKEPSQLEIRRLLKCGQSHKGELPNTLIIPSEHTAETCTKEAEQLGISVIRVPDNELSEFLDEARKEFQAHVSGGRAQ
jgi:hypothetical protein